MVPLRWAGSTIGWSCNAPEFVDQASRGGSWGAGARSPRRRFGQHERIAAQLLATTKMRNPRSAGTDDRGTTDSCCRNNRSPRPLRATQVLEATGPSATGLAALLAHRYSAGECRVCP